MTNIIVLGAGMVGSAMAIDLSKKHQVTIADFSENVVDRVMANNPLLKGLVIDASVEQVLKSSLQPFDFVICAVPGFMGYQTLKWIIEAKKNVVDISFFPENALDLHELAEQHQVTAIVDCGVAPGMSNIILGHHNESMKIASFECLVGGLPKSKKWPFCYKAPFSPVDVIEEYTRPARYVEQSNVIVKPALSDVEHVEFENIGTLESFNSDGLRSLIFTMDHIPNMKEKTLRYPGHVEYIQVLKQSGFFRTHTIHLEGGVEITPLEFTSKILFDEWKLGSTEPEFTVMRMTLSGINEIGRPETITYDLYDEYDSVTKTSSMARTTGYTATAVANLVLDGLFTEKGVFPPELMSYDTACFDYIMKYLYERGIIYKKETIMGC